MRTHTFPRTLFQLANHTSEGLDCIPDKPPVERPISFGSASSTLGDAEEVRVFGSSPLRNHARNRSCLAAQCSGALGEQMQGCVQVLNSLHLAPFPRPLASLVEDYPPEQGHKGWLVRAPCGARFAAVPCHLHGTGDAGTKRSIAQVGFVSGPNGSDFKQLAWHAGEGGEGFWGCPDQSMPYPAMHHMLLHPCVAPGSETCCGGASASFTMRFQSFAAAPRGMLIMAYEVRAVWCTVITLINCASALSCQAVAANAGVAHLRRRPGPGDPAHGGR